jgi:hypothetical protein
VVRHRMLLEQWARCGGTMAEACRWVLAKLDALEQEKRNLARDLTAMKARLAAVEGDARIGRYLEQVRALEKNSEALLAKARSSTPAEQAPLFVESAK